MINHDKPSKLQDVTGMSTGVISFACNKTYENEATSIYNTLETTREGHIYMIYIYIHIYIYIYT